MIDINKITRQCIVDIKDYVPGKPIEEVKRELGLVDVIKLSSNENPLGPSPKALEALSKYAKDVYLYPDQSCYELTRLLAEKLDVPPEASFLLLVKKRPSA